MKFGILFMPLDPPDGIHIQQRWEEIIDAAVVAEQVGFDGCFLPEHHFRPDGFCTSPLVALAAIGARTKTLELGTSTIVLPCHNPISVAEQGALVDVLSGGRLILGIGLGNVERELRAFGVLKEDKASRFEENLQIIRRAWAEDEFSFCGKHYSYSKLSVTPKPIQHPAPPIWLGAMSEPGVRRAGRCGLPWITDPLNSRSVICKWSSIYHQAAAASGHQPMVVLIRDGWVGESLDAVENIWWPHARPDHWRYVSELPRWASEMEPWLNDVKSIEDFTFEGHRSDRLIVGSPGEVIASLRQFASSVPTGYIILRFRLATGPSHEDTIRCIRLFGDRVISVLGGKN